MKQAKVWLEWTPSVSLDVKSTHVSVEVGDDVVFDVDLPANANGVEVGTYNEGDILVATVSVFDGTFTTDAETSFQVPDLTKPEPVTGLNWKYEVVE